MTVNMTKFNTVPTNMSDDMGNIVTKMVTRGTSAVFGELEFAIYRENVHVKMCMYGMHGKVTIILFPNSRFCKITKSIREFLAVKH